MAEQDRLRGRDIPDPGRAWHRLARPGRVQQSKLHFCGYHRPNWPSSTRSPLLKQPEE